MNCTLSVTENLKLLQRKTFLLAVGPILTRMEKNRYILSGQRSQMMLVVNNTDTADTKAR